MLSLLKANPLALKAIAIGAVLVMTALGIQQIRIGWLKTEVAEQRARNSQLVADKRILTEANQQCAESVAIQSAAINAWKADQKAREAEAAKRTKEAELRAARWEAEATDLRSRPMPVPGNQCASLETILNEEIAGRK